MSVDELFVRILELESRIGLAAGGATYSGRILAVLDALESDAHVGGDGQTVESKLASLKHLIGDIGEAAHEGHGDATIEAKVAEIKEILD